MIPDWVGVRPRLAPDGECESRIRALSSAKRERGALVLETVQIENASYEVVLGRYGARVWEGDLAEPVAGARNGAARLSVERDGDHGGRDESNYPVRSRHSSCLRSMEVGAVHPE